MFVQFTERLRQKVDSIWEAQHQHLFVHGLPERDLRRLEEAFVTCSRYEWRLWDMAWKRESWQV